ncbi:hypothetical protein OGATHE_003815 [Ogataea polymorpha]|uniref:Uncharacterized protein n=1 Tax=Ogataea polymorpha TaxID=460523 RepID=A0A9P8T4F1_9ASCO|nr:hypothetical protein OGATHE_003815 [Ogataea polymorpha]
MYTLWSSPSTGFSTNGFLMVSPSTYKVSSSSIFQSGSGTSEVSTPSFSSLTFSSSSTKGPPSLEITNLFGVGTPAACRIWRQSRLSQSTFCITRSLMVNGLRNFWYAIALSRGNPLEKNEIKKSQVGQFSMASSNITLSPNMTVSNSPFSIKRFKICLHGLLSTLLSIAHTPMIPILGNFGPDTSETEIDDVLFLCCKLTPELEAEMPFDEEADSVLPSLKFNAFSEVTGELSAPAVSCCGLP